MSRLSEDAWKVITAFQRYVKNGNGEEVNAFSLSELRATDEQLGNRDVGADFRLAMQNRIKDIEQREQKKHESKIRALNVVVVIIVGLVIAGLAKLIFGT